MGIEPGATYQLNPWMYMTMCLLDFPNSSVLQFATTDFFFSFINSLSLPEYLAPHLRFLCSNHNRSLGQQIICFTFTPLLYPFFSFLMHSSPKSGWLQTALHSRFVKYVNFFGLKCQYSHNDSKQYCKTVCSASREERTEDIHRYILCISYFYIT